MAKHLMDVLDLANALALGWFLFCWVGYTLFARWRANYRHCLASILHDYRARWLRQLLQHDNRVSEASLLGNLGRNVNFFASTTILILAGVLTVLTTSESAINLVRHLPFAAPENPQLAEFKIVVLAIVFIYAFFQFTWSMRQYGFCAVFFGSAPLTDGADIDSEQSRALIEHGAKLLDCAGNAFNYGLRAYYFALAAVGWLINTSVFVSACGLIVVVLYLREFHSRSLHALLASYDYPR